MFAIEHGLREAGAYWELPCQPVNQGQMAVMLLVHS